MLPEYLLNAAYIVAVVVLVWIILGMLVSSKKEGYGSDNKPFEADNTLLHRNPFDDINYIRPRFVL